MARRRKGKRTPLPVEIGVRAAVAKWGQAADRVIEAKQASLDADCEPEPDNGDEPWASSWTDG